MKKETFTITKDHLTLLKKMYVSWNDDMYFGAPAIDIKRPYGNKDVHGDIAEMLGWKVTETIDGEVLSKKQYELADKLHKETAKVLQICLCTQKFEIGKYVRQGDYEARSWRKA